MRAGKFLTKKPVQVVYKKNEAYYLVQYLMNERNRLAGTDEKETQPLTLSWKFTISILETLCRRLATKRVYEHQKQVKITYSHTEALFLLTHYSEEEELGYTIMQLYKHYI